VLRDPRKSCDPFGMTARRVALADRTAYEENRYLAALAKRGSPVLIVWPGALLKCFCHVIFSLCIRQVGSRADADIVMSPPTSST
jgi:hypothetical protein